ncbi:hypothetical protein GC197_18545 [bacterium]|nr:hypothetical protein [bacterium]
MHQNHLFLALLILLTSGCEEGLEQTEMVPIDNVPQSVMKVAQEKLPGVKFDSAWTEKEGDKVYYEVRGKTADGKTRDIKVSTEGVVVEVD